MSARTERVNNELALLRSMYPDQIAFEEKAQEVRFATSTQSARLVVRIPPAYLESELPTILLAAAGNSDLRQTLHDYLHSDCAIGEECIDRIILHFEGLAEQSFISTTADRRIDVAAAGHHKATVVVWLHHLLNTNKRKHAVSPPSTSVQGVTKPGYPGVLIYSGPAEAVQDHVRDLRSLNWQAFQVRLQVEEEWQFTHGPGVIEVGEMSEVVAEIGESRKEVFMEAMRMK